MDLSCINDILHVQIPSLLRQEMISDWYRSEAGKIARVLTVTDKKYSLALNTPYSDKLKYFDLNISNCVHQYFNEFSDRFWTSQNTDHKKFLVDKYLNREVVQKIQDTAHVIISKNLQWENHNKPEQLKNREVIFILQSLKFNLIWLYLEIKKLVEHAVNDGYQTLETLLAEHFHEYDCSSPHIKENQEF